MNIRNWQEARGRWRINVALVLMIAGSMAMFGQQITGTSWER